MKQKHKDDHSVARGHILQDFWRDQYILRDGDQHNGSEAMTVSGTP
jgi:hypothetical protein